MKNKILFGVVALLASVFVTLSVIQNSQREDVSDLMLANVEALANYEWDQNGWYCWRYSSDDYNSDVFFTYIRCFDCNMSTAVSVWDQGQCWH